MRALLEELPDEATIGVVTPFTPQADELRAQLRQYGRQRVRVGTVHTFQGGERDVMVFSSSPVKACTTARSAGSTASSTSGTSPSPAPAATSSWSAT
ncbi:AAA domain-containing protein [Streptomyces erythrogriseus]